MTNRHRRRGFSLTELLVVISLIAVLLGLLFPALAGIRSTGLMTTSMSNLRQIGVWMRMYSDDNREFIVPSRFDYGASTNNYKGKVRAPLDQNGSPVNPAVGRRHQGTWSDILWTVFEGGVFPDAAKDPALGHDYRYDSPDGALYDSLGTNLTPNPLRSAVEIKTYPDFKGRDENNCDPDDLGDLGPGISAPWDAAVGHPGFFAANNFFDAAAPGRNGPGWVITGQIKSPERSMYLVDSLIGETIDPLDPPFDSAGPCLEVDFRYPGDVCLMLFLDGHAQTVAKFDDLDELQGKHVMRDGTVQLRRQIRVQDLDQR